MISVHDIDVNKPVFQLIRILGQLQVAGMQRRKIPLSAMLINGGITKTIDQKRFCIKFDNIVSLNLEYAAMVPWAERDTEFDQFYR